MTGKSVAIGFDADDTLWHNEEIFRLTQERFAELLSPFVAAEHLGERLLAAEERNLGHYGYGVKGFVLSMIETAIEVTQARVPASVLCELIEAGRSMLSHPIELLPHAQESVATLADQARLVLITKGDLLDQERKLAQSGLGRYFDDVRIVSEKTDATYPSAFSGAALALMVGNSLRSDVAPAIAAGFHGVHVPYPLTWALEDAQAPYETPFFHHINDLSYLAPLIGKL